ncbi:hypothetical protein JW756_04250 [Candidatus Woesearchaeota archaeon]|nr:hypothetical protein [Candidatus Woesearchaeota archaeon]
MVDDTVKTGVDELLELLKKIDKIALTDAAQQLGISSSLLQSWVDFLVEEEVVGIEYKFTKPIIYLNKAPETKEVRVKKEAEVSFQAYKDDFKTRAAQKSIPAEKISFLWQEHVKAALNRRKDFFFREAKKRNLANINYLWQTYNAHLVSS